MSLHLFLVILAAVCLALAGLGVGVPRVSLGWLGMLFWLLSITLH